MGILTKLLEFLELFEELHRLIGEKDISDQTLILTAGIVLLLLVAGSWLRRFFTILRQEKTETRKVADERDEFEEIIFARKSIHRKSSKDYDLELTLFKFVKGTLKSKRRDGDNKGKGQTVTQKRRQKKKK